MKKYILSLLLIGAIAGAQTSKACDVCGCGIGGYYLGILPQYQKHLLGVRYRQQQFKSFFGEDLFGENQEGFSTETFQTTEIWGRFYPLPKLQLLAYVPFQFLERKSPNAPSETLNGLGDVTLLALWEAVTTNNPERKLQHKLLLGGGAMLPTGKSTFSSEGETNPNFQLGTGSLDGSLQLVYIVRYKMMGINADASYRFNGKNDDDYRFGNRYNLSVSGFHLFEAKSWAFMPSVGLAAEWAEKDESGEFFRSQTGGKAVMSHLGLDVYQKQWNLGISWQHPISQTLADDRLQANNRFQAQLNFLF